MPDDLGREARRHGARAQKRGISNEYVALRTGVGRFGGNVAVAVSRARPGADEIARVLGGRIENGTLVLTDGNKSYETLEKECGCEGMALGAKHPAHPKTSTPRMRFTVSSRSAWTECAESRQNT